MKIALRLAFVSGSWTRNVAHTTPIVLLLVLMGSMQQPAWAQPDYRFGTAGASGAEHLGMLWYRDYNDSLSHQPPPGLRKLWTVGKVDGRSDYAAMGLETRLPDGTPVPFEFVWPLLGLAYADPLDPRTREVVQAMTPLVSTLVSTYMTGKVNEVWAEAADSIEDAWEGAADTDMCYWRPRKTCWYRVFASDPSVSASDTLSLTFTPRVRQAGSGVLELGQMKASFTTDWRFRVTDNQGIVTATPRLRTTIDIRLTVALGFEAEGGSWFFVSGAPVVEATTVTLTHTKWRALGITFTSRRLDRKVRGQVDATLEKAVPELLATLDANGNAFPDLTEELNIAGVLGDYFFGGGRAPSQDEVLLRIFEREQPQIAAAIGAGLLQQHWEVGNEPNWFPYMTPRRYALHYVRYYELIMGLDPHARLLHGGLFAKEFVDNPGELVAERFDLNVAGVDLARLLNVLFGAETTATWFSEFRAVLPSRFAVPVGNLHVYPLGTSDPRNSPQTFAAVLGTSVQMLREAGAGEVWVTEFGNIDWRSVEDDVAALAGRMVQGLRCQADVTKWFWFTSEPFEIFGVPVMTHLLRPSNGSRALTQVGLTYQRFYQLGTLACEADVDDNACVDTGDVATVVAASSGLPMPHPFEAYDLDRDGVVGAGDVARVVALFTNPDGAPCQ